MLNKEKHEEKEELDEMTEKFFGDEFLGATISAASEYSSNVSITSFAADFSRIVEHIQEKEQQKNTVEMKNLQEIANDLSLEVKVNERSVPRSLKEKSIHPQIYPTDETFEMLRRWEAIHEKQPDEIPYDAEAIENRDWQEIHNVYGDIDDDRYNDLFKYITERYPSENNTVKEVEKELYHTDNR